jgi:hypothetical protein
MRLRVAVSAQGKINHTIHRTNLSPTSETPMFDVPTENIRVDPKDLDALVTWMPTVRAKLNPGSDWFVEVGHNGNGNIEVCKQPAK